MADFDPQQPADNEEEAQNKPTQQGGSKPWDYSHSCCDSTRSDSECSEPESCASGSRPDSFVSDWSGAEKSLSEQAASFEARSAEMDEGPSEQFWVDLVKSQSAPVPEARELRDDERPRQSGQFWSEVSSQQPASDGVGESSSHYSTNNAPRGMGWSEDEASEWSPPYREEGRVDSAAEPLEAEGTPVTRRDDVEWGTPASAQDDWQSVRSEALQAESKQQSLTGEAAEASQPKEAAKKSRKASAKKPAKKKAVAKKAKAKKPAKKASAKKPAKKKAAKKVVKKDPTPPPTAQDPTRQAA